MCEFLITRQTETRDTIHPLAKASQDRLQQCPRHSLPFPSPSSPPRPPPHLTTTPDPHHHAPSYSK